MSLGSTQRCIAEEQQTDAGRETLSRVGHQWRVTSGDQVRAENDVIIIVVIITIVIIIIVFIIID
jgi:hypothetical protein